MAGSGKKQRLLDWIERCRPTQIGGSEFAEIHAALAPISESYLRKLLRSCGVPLVPMVGGVLQGNPQELEASLLALVDEYKHSDRVGQAAVRRLVITAKEHARLAALRAENNNQPAARKGSGPGAPEKRAETILWLSTWLENPPLFPEWVRLRKNAVQFPGMNADEE